MSDIRVLYDGQAFDMQTYGGVSRCFAELYRHLPAMVHAQFGIYETDNVYLRDMGVPPVGYTYRHFISNREFPLKWEIFKAYYNLKYGHPGNWNHAPNLNQYLMESLLQEGQFDVFHPTFFNDYFLSHIGQKPFVLTVHDMIPELFPEYYASDDLQIRQKRQIIPAATHLIAVSEQTKKDLIRMMKVPEDKVTVVYHGADTTPYIPSENRIHDFEYILYVGERHFYKNFLPFCRASVPVLKRHKELRVVCTGKPFNQEELAFFDVNDMGGRFVHQFVESDQLLMDLYHHAVAFVYPSAYEGFGIPILEAYKAGCPVMLNQTSCFPEIAGDAAVYFKINHEKSDFEEQFETLYHLDANERQRLLSKQRERLERYSWDKSAEQLAGIYRQIANL